MTLEPEQSRKSPRRPTIAEAILEADGASFKGIVTDLSSEGAFIRADETLTEGGWLSLEIGLPTGGKSVKTRGRVVRAGSGGLGVRFEELPARSRSRLRSYSGYYETDETIVQLQRHLEQDLPTSLLPLGEQDEIREILQQAVDRRCDCSLFENVGALDPQHCRFEKLDTDASVMDFDSGVLHLNVSQRPIKPDTKVVHLVFSIGPLYYAFEAIVLSAGSHPSVLVPERIYLSERRSQSRAAVADESWIKFPGNGPEAAVRLQVSDLTDHGASLRLPSSSLVVPGMRFPEFELHDAARCVRVDGATVRYVAPSGPDQIRVGLSFEAVEQPARDAFAGAITRNADRRWSRRLLRLISVVSGRLSLMLRPRMPEDSDELEIVRYTNDRGDRVAALIDANFDTSDSAIKPDVAVVIAPALLKRKELFGLLARTIIDNLNRAGKLGVVLRFDGSHLVGESSMDAKLVAEGRNNYNWTMSHLRSDIEASLDYLRNRFGAQKQALVTISIASIPARKVVLRREDLVDLWVAPFGCPDAQDVMRNYLAGLDLFEGYEKGEGPETIMIHGRPVDGRNLYGDALEAKMAYLKDGREDMSRITIPVTWLLGQFDHWVTRSRVRAMLEAPGGGIREVFEFPTGHVVKEGPEAIEVAKVISETIGKHLFLDDRPAVEPNLVALTRQSDLEWSRVGKLTFENAGEFWRQHLFGGPDSGIGYDIMLSHPDYRTFLRRQVELLDLRGGHTIAEFGCGTGNLTVEIAREAAGLGGLKSLVYMDMVPEALKKTEEKLHDIAGTETAGRGLLVDLETIRMAPIRDFVQGRLFGVNELVGRISGLTPRTAEKITTSYGKELHAILRGQQSRLERVKELSPALTESECEIVLEISSASRQVRSALSGRESDKAVLADSEFPLLALGGARLKPELDFECGSFDRVSGSLLLPYLTDPSGFLQEVYRLLKPGGIAVLSSVLSNFDPSKLYAESAQYVGQGAASAEEAETLMDTLRYFGDSISRLVELEEDGRFHFHDRFELEQLGKEAGFAEVAVTTAFGNPPVATILRAVK